MSDTGKQSPLGINVLGTLLQNQGFYINPKVRNLIGVSKTNEAYTPGECIENTCLKWLTYAINNAFNRGLVDNTTYENMLNIGQSRIPALGNSMPPTYLVEDPSDQWEGQATTSYSIAGDTGQGQEAKWWPLTYAENPNISVSQWGWLRLITLQAWNEFNYNGKEVTQEVPEYRYFLQSFLTYQGFIDYSNKAIFAINDSKDFLKGVYSNMDDLTSGDITGVSLANRAFGQDLINLGKAMDLSYISTFGLPSNLLQTLKKNNAITINLSTALLASGLSGTDINNIFNGSAVSLEQEQALYGAFLVITEDSLKEITDIINCKTKGLTSLADLLNMRKLFPISYQSLTVPIYNTVPNPTNSKTYYLLFVNGKLNPQLIAPEVVEQLPAIIPPIPAPPPEPEPPIYTPAITIEDVIEEVVPITLPAQPPPITTQEPPPLPFVTGRDPAPGGGCPAPHMRILLSDGTYIPAGDLKKGMFVKTKHEHTLEEGSYRVDAVRIEEHPRVEIVLDHVNFICSTSHKFYHNGRWLEAKDVTPGTVLSGKRVKKIKFMQPGEVVRITVRDAHTYICEQLFSHNKYVVGGGGCVALESFVPLVEKEKKHNGREITKAWMLESGMKISLGTDNLEIVDGSVVKTLNDYQPCVRIVTSDGITLVCSTTAPILTKDKGFIPATEVYGKRVAVMRNGRTWYDEVVQLEDVGMKFVRVIDAGNNSFWAGERPGSFILHHNVPINDAANYEKK